MRRLHHVFIASRVEKAGRDQNYGLVAGVLGRLALHDARHRRPALAAVPANLAARSDLGAAQPDCRSLIATGSFPRPIEPSTTSVTSVGMVAPACRPLPRAAMPHARGARSLAPGLQRPSDRTGAWVGSRHGPMQVCPQAPSAQRDRTLVLPGSSASCPVASASSFNPRPDESRGARLSASGGLIGSLVQSSSSHRC